MNKTNVVIIVIVGKLIAALACEFYFIFVQMIDQFEIFCYAFCYTYLYLYFMNKKISIVTDQFVVSVEDVLGHGI